MTQSSLRAAEQGGALSLRKLSLFSSGLGFFEHSGNVSSSASSPARITLPFSMNAVNDALKSLVVNDPRSDFPTVTYASASALRETLRSLKIDLSGNPGMAEILNGLKGADLEISAPGSVTGRILGVEYRPLENAEQPEAYLSLFTAGGIRTVAFKDINSFSFRDPAINSDLTRALDLILNSRDSNKRDLLLSLPGEGSREVSLSYVIPVPVWKVSYRLDLGGSQNGAGAGNSGASFFQGWAIVDNDSDTDWNDVELSLVTGRPVSFIQNLYAPYNTSRPVLPLAIAGIAESRTYESGSGMEQAKMAEAPMARAGAAPSPQAAEAAYDMMVMEEEYDTMVTAGVPAQMSYQTASGRAAGDQFEFTIKDRVSIDRRSSAMLPLVQHFIKAEKTLVFSGSNAARGVSVNPAISAELTNTSGMKLPAGPLTVYDGGTYAGDALIEFFPENEKRLVSYGDDLSVSGSAAFSNSRLVTAVNISRGVMTITRRQNYERVYTIRNASGETKKLIIEHPVTPGAKLSEPAAYDERTPELYRFTTQLPANQEIKFTVKEDAPLSERVVLAQLRPETFLSYTSNQEIPANVRTALERAVELKQKNDEAAAAKQDLENQRTRLVSEQDRIRRNLEAAGNQTSQGQEYLRRMVAMDGEIDALNTKISGAEERVLAAKKEYENYLGMISI